ncbi:hypothetical protein HYQ46_011234 [Verticillium longisporum]|nr:hypothetical protein HYQ46_011234 [Verticillium longisporum]
MVSVKVLLALLPLALQATALPSPLEENHLERRVCVPPTNCSPIGNCEFCCRTGVTPNSSGCHSHGETECVLIPNTRPLCSSSLCIACIASFKPSGFSRSTPPASQIGDAATREDR